MYKSPKFYGPQLLYQKVKVHIYFFTGKVLLLESYHKIIFKFVYIWTNEETNKINHALISFGNLFDRHTLLSMTLVLQVWLHVADTANLR